MITIFYIFLMVTLYIYLFYVLLLSVLIVFIRKSKKIFQGKQRKVSFLIPAKNEEAVIQRKIENCLELDYPKDKIEFIVISDGSTDNTVQIVKKYKDHGVELIELKENHGKTEAQNIAVQQANGEVIIFSDANAIYNKDAVKHLVKYFEDPDVGCVSGELHYLEDVDNPAGTEESLYWKYEKIIKRLEDRFNTIIGANGSIYAVRKSDYVPLETDIISDFIEPLEVKYRGKKVIYEPMAESYEKSSTSFDHELKRKRRIICRSIHSLFRHRHLLNPLKNPVLSFQLVSHKLLRWFSPVFQIGLFFSNMGLIDSPLFRAFFILQCFFYFLSILGYFLKDNKRLPSTFFTPFYFNLHAYASLMGILDWLRGKNVVKWEPIR